MTTFHERAIALNLGRELMASLAAAEDMPAILRKHAKSIIDAYPGAASIANRLEDLEGYRLLFAVQAISGAADLIMLITRAREVPPELVQHCARAQHVARHFPEPPELSGAIASPHAARWWAAFHLDRSPGRDGLLVGQPASSPDMHSSPDERLKALLQLPKALAELTKDPGSSALLVKEAWAALSGLPPPSWLESQFLNASPSLLIRIFESLERGCQLVEAVDEGILAAGASSQTSARALRLHLPRGDAFPLNGLGEHHRIGWIDWLLSEPAGAAKSTARPSAKDTALAIRYFQIRKSIWLAFFNGRDQYDRQIDPGQGLVMFDRCDVLWRFEETTLISDTSNRLLTTWLEDGSIEEVDPPQGA